MGVSEKIRQIREEQGLGVAEVARRAGLSLDFWYKIEAGKKRPSLNTLEKKIAPALNRAPTDFFTP